jgi:hypothetical protein
MHSGMTVFILIRLILGAFASFLAIMLWSRTRDMAWMLVIMGIVVSFAETVYSVLTLFGLLGGNKFLVSIVLPCLPAVFFILALMIMVFRKYRGRLEN